MQILKNRVRVLAVVFIVALLCLVARLIYLQIITGAVYRNLSEEKVSLSFIKKAPRGEITDRYGRVLVKDVPEYSLVLSNVYTNVDKYNDSIVKALNIMEKNGVFFKDSFPVNSSGTEFVFKDSDKKTEWVNKYNFCHQAELPQNVLYAFSDRYGINKNLHIKDIRRLVGVRYETENKGLKGISILTLAENLSPQMVAELRELLDNNSCMMICENYSRQYLNEGIGSHILGRVGKINSQEYNEYKSQGYGIHDFIGKEGVEKLCEEYLRGTDGYYGTSSQTAELYEKQDAVGGGRIILTIDFEMQKVLENSLLEQISHIRQSGGYKTGADAYAGAGVVVDVNSGEVLACASYPTYNAQTFTEDFSKLVKNVNLPLWNRAVSGTYSPGSTFKPLVALAALENKKIQIDETICDKGIYDYYDDYRPRCWIWSEKRTTHGSINVSRAIETSCNYFFYEAGRRTGIEKISQFGTKFGLGKYTGIGLAEESKGYIASPDNKRKLFKNKAGKTWYGADTLQASIGQSIHSFTPVQMANYAATLANGGTRYRLNLIKSVRSGVDGSLMLKNEPIVEEKISLDKANLNSVLNGMKNVVEEGSAKDIFEGYKVEIGGKTGTAQVGTNVSNNALFIAFAPFYDPEIAICVVLEHGVKGTNAAYVAKDVFDYFFR